MPPGVYFLYLTGYFGECGEYEIELDVLECGSAEAEDTPGEFALRQNLIRTPSIPAQASTSVCGRLALPACRSTILLGSSWLFLWMACWKRARTQVNFDAANLSSGVYVYTLQSGSGSLSRKDGAGALGLTLLSSEAD